LRLQEELLLVSRDNDKAYSRFICVKIICIEKVKLLDQCQGTAKKREEETMGCFERARLRVAGARRV
jgi:hypothetical protein